MNEKFSRGGVVSQPPFGYKMGDDVFLPNEKTAPIVKMFFEDYISGMGVRKIAMKLNDMGIRSTKGNPFENRTVEYILTNPTYLGKLRRMTTQTVLISQKIQLSLTDSTNRLSVKSYSKRQTTV